MHIGSGVDMAHLARVAEAAVGFARLAGPQVTALSAGGGLPTPYREGDVEVDVDAYFEIWDAERRRLAADFGHPLRLEIEPGRYLVAESGWLVAEIRAVKRQGANLFYVLDAGFNNLRAADPLRRLPPDGDRARRGAPRRSGRSATSSSPARSASPGTSSPRTTAAWCAPSRCPRRGSATRS